MSPDPAKKETLAQSLGLNRATVAVLVVIGSLGLSEEIWSTFFSVRLNELTGGLVKAAMFVGVSASLINLLEGFGYIIGGAVAHRMGARTALAISSLPMTAGFIIMLSTGNPWVMVAGSLLLTNWEPLSVPATFDVVGAEVPKNRRTIAFAMQSIQKRLPKVVGPVIGGVAFAMAGYRLNLMLSFALVGVAVVLQLLLSRRMRPKIKDSHVPFRVILREMPPELKMLLTAEIFIRWGDWFARNFAPLYLVNLFVVRAGWSEPSAVKWAGFLVGLTSFTALTTYIPVAKWADKSPSPRPFIGLTFLLFAIFPICLVLLPRASVALGLPMMVGLVITYILNGLREIGEPARKALIATGFKPEIRARAVGLYWGLRSFAFFPAPLVAAWLWGQIGPDKTFLLGGAIGLFGTAWYAVATRLTRAKAS